MQKHLAKAVRPLGSLEHLLWLLDQAHSIHMAFTAEITGTAPEKEWRQALDRVQERHPLLSTGVDGTHGAPRFSRAARVKIPLQFVEGDPSRWEGEVYREFTTPFAHDEAPLVRAVVVQGRGKTAFIMTAHHCLTDGMGLCYLIRDTLEALSGKTLEALPVTPSMDALLGLEEPMQSGEAEKPVPPVQRSPFWSPMRTLKLDRDVTARIKAKAKQEGATVHAALMAAAVVTGRTLSPDWQGIPLRVLSPINHRKFLGVGEDCGVYATGATTNFPADMSASAGLWDLARHASASLSGYRSGDGAGPAVAGLRQFTGTGPDAAKAAQFAATALARDAVVTNHGELPFATDYGALKLDAIWAAILSSFAGTEQIVVVATLNGAICLTHSAHTPIPGLLEGMRDALLSESA